MSVQFLEHNGIKQFAILPVDEYMYLIEKAEMLDDIKAFDDAININDELIPSEVAEKLINGENKIKVWREYRQLSQIELANRSEIPEASIAKLETGMLNASAIQLEKIAEILNLEQDDLV